MICAATVTILSEPRQKLGLLLLTAIASKFGRGASVTLTLRLALLLPGFGSAVALLTLPVLVITPSGKLSGTRTVTTSDAVLFEGFTPTRPIAQLTILVVPVQLPRLGVIAISSSPAGSGSVITTSSASDTPRLVIVRV